MAGGQCIKSGWEYRPRMNWQGGRALRHRADNAYCFYPHVW